MKFDLEREADKLLLLLIITDILFMIVHVLYGFRMSTGLFYNPNFSLVQDRGYAEVFQYIKEFWITVLLLVLAIRASNLLYFCWALLFGYFLVDDSFEIHEALGHRLASTLGSSQIFGFNTQDFGELFAFGFFGILFLIGIGVSYRSSPDEAKEISRYLFAMLVVLVVFGVVTGLFQGTASDRSTWQFILSMIEEGGEMLVMSVIAWFVFHVNPEL
jgi:hypothetical protein